MKHSMICRNYATYNYANAATRTYVAAAGQPAIPPVLIPPEPPSVTAKLVTIVRDLRSTSTVSPTNSYT